MRLGLVIYGDLNLVTGGFMYDRYMVEHLRRQGDTVEVISLPWRPYSLGLLDNFKGALIRRLRQAPFDALIQDELTHPSLFWLNHRLKSRLPYPIISLVHLLRCTEARPAWQNAGYGLIEKRYLQSVDGFIYISRHTRQVVEALTGSTRPGTIAYPAGDRLGGLSPEEITAKVRSPGPRQILYLGAVIPRKGLDILIRALAPLREADWHLTVAGSLSTDPGYCRTIYRLISRFGLSHRICLPGVLQGQKLLDCLRRSHILAVPSFVEGLALVYLEGMYFGLVPLAAAQGAAGEVITPGQDGFLIPPRDVQTLSATLATLLTDHHRLLAMSLAARERIGRHPTWEETGAAIRAFLLQMTGAQ